LTADGIQIALLVLAFLPTCLFGIGFIYLLLKDPDKLQSEDYQLHKRALDIIEEKGGQIQVLATSLESITNPAPRTLPGRNPGEQP
jgi:hypothetical protein